jgi:hypothetical protein
MDEMAQKPGYKGTVDSDKKSFMDLQVAAGDDIEGYMATGEGFTPRAMASTAQAMQVLDQTMRDISLQQKIDQAPKIEPSVETQQDNLELKLDLTGAEGSPWAEQFQATPTPPVDINKAELDVKKANIKQEGNRMSTILKENQKHTDQVLQKQAMTLDQLQLWLNTNVNDKSSDAKAAAVVNNSNTNVTNITTAEPTQQQQRGKARSVTDPLLGN